MKMTIKVRNRIMLGYNLILYLDPVQYLLFKRLKENFLPEKVMPIWFSDRERITLILS